MLVSLGADPERMSLWSYAADPAKLYRGQLTQKHHHDSIRLLTVGQLNDRKGVLPALHQVCQWANKHPTTTMEWHVLGVGPLEQAMRDHPLPPNLELALHGHCDPLTIQQHYRDSDALIFPTLSDEWGLVVDEALFSGLPVIGSCHSQAVETLLEDGVNGMIYDPETPDSLPDALDRFMQLPQEQFSRMPIAARSAVASRTPSASATQLIQAIDCAIEHRNQ
jgi:hypothetical protein